MLNFFVYIAFEICFCIHFQDYLVCFYSLCHWQHSDGIHCLPSSILVSLPSSNSLTSDKPHPSSEAETVCISTSRLGPIISLILIGIGTGGIKPCVAAFGGDQFSSEQAKELAQFFSIFYFSINLGSLFSTILTPLIRSEGHELFFLSWELQSLLSLLQNASLSFAMLLIRWFSSQMFI